MIILQFACMKEICNIRFCSDLGLVYLPFHISSQSLTLVLGSCSWETRTHNLNQRSVLLCSGKPLSKEHEVGASEARREHLPSQPEQLNQSWKINGVKDAVHRSPIYSGYWLLTSVCISHQQCTVQTRKRRGWGRKGTMSMGLSFKNVLAVYLHCPGVRNMATLTWTSGQEIC